MAHVAPKVTFETLTAARAAWNASVPAMLRPADGLRLMSAAIALADAAVKDVAVSKDKPRDLPDILANVVPARNKAVAMRNGFEVLANRRKTVGDIAWPKGSKMWQATRQNGSGLIGRALELVRARDVYVPPSKFLIHDLKQSAKDTASIGVPVIALAVGALAYLHFNRR